MIALLMVFLSSWSFASANDAKLELLIGAKSKEEMRSAVSDGNSIEVLKRECAQEVELRRVPEACFHVSRLELKRNLLSEEKFETKIRRLNGLCKRAARESHDLNRLEQALASELSPSCKAAVKSRVDDLSYQLVSESWTDF